MNAVWLKQLQMHHKIKYPGSPIIDAEYLKTKIGSCREHSNYCLSAHKIRQFFMQSRTKARSNWPPKAKKKSILLSF